MSALLGGFLITSAAWLDSQTIEVRFSSTYTDRYHQLYSGRTLIGVSSTFAARAVSGPFEGSHWPEPLQLVAVTADDRHTDFGSNLPPRPYNRVKLGWTTAGWTDAESIEVIAGDVAGGAVDTSNVLARVPFDANRVYDFLTAPLPGSGTWNFEVAGRDETVPNGNRGNALAIALAIDAHPPDVALNGNGTRLTAAVAAGVLTVGFAYDW